MNKYILILTLNMAEIRKDSDQGHLTRPVLSWAFDSIL